MKALFVFFFCFFLFPVGCFAGQSSASAGASVQFAPQFNSVSRAYPGPAQMVQPNLPTLFSNPGQHVNFMSFEQIIKLKQFWTLKQVKDFLKKSTDLSAKTYISNKLPSTKNIFFLTKIPDNFSYIGDVVVNAAQTNDGNVNSETLFAKAAKMAMENGGNAILLCTEGGTSYLHATASTISLGYTSMSIGKNYSGVGGAGIGHAWGSVQYYSRPYARFAILQIKSLTIK